MVKKIAEEINWMLDTANENMQVMPVPIMIAEILKLYKKAKGNNIAFQCLILPWAKENFPTWSITADVYPKQIRVMINKNETEALRWDQLIIKL